MQFKKPIVCYSEHGKGVSSNFGTTFEKMERATGSLSFAENMLKQTGLMGPIRWVAECEIAKLRFALGKVDESTTLMMDITNKLINKIDRFGPAHSSTISNIASKYGTGSMGVVADKTGPELAAISVYVGKTLRMLGMDVSFNKLKKKSATLLELVNDDVIPGLRVGCIETFLNFKNERETLVFHPIFGIEIDFGIEMNSISDKFVMKSSGCKPGSWVNQDMHKFKELVKKTVRSISMARAKGDRTREYDGLIDLAECGLAASQHGRKEEAERISDILVYFLKKNITEIDVNNKEFYASGDVFGVRIASVRAALALISCGKVETGLDLDLMLIRKENNFDEGERIYDDNVSMAAIRYYVREGAKVLGYPVEST